MTKPRDNHLSKMTDVSGAISHILEEDARMQKLMEEKLHVDEMHRKEKTLLGSLKASVKNRERANEQMERKIKANLKKNTKDKAKIKTKERRVATLQERRVNLRTKVRSRIFQVIQIEKGRKLKDIYKDIGLPIPERLQRIRAVKQSKEDKDERETGSGGAHHP